MRQALHIFRKDLRRGWPLLLLWAAILVYWIAPIWRDPLEAAELERIDSMRSGLIVLGGMIVAALAIQHDPLVGVREFWMTRPVRRASLLAAKALFVGGFVVLPPLVIQFALLVRYGLPPERWTPQAVDLALPWASAIALACLAAAWTRGLPGFIALSVALLLLPNFGVGAANLIRGARVSFGLPIGFLPALGLVALALIVLQYATRRRVAGALIGGVLFGAVALGVFRFDPYSYLHRTFTPTLPAVQVELSPGPGRETFAAERPGATAGRVMDLWFVPSPVRAGAGDALEISRVDGEIEWADGRSTPFYASGEWYLSDSPAASVGFDWAEGLGPREAWRALGVRGEESFESLLGRTGALRGKAAGSVWRLAEVKRLPLEAGAEHQHAGSKVRILGVERAPGELGIRLRSREIVNLWRSYPRMQVALANAARGETVPLSFRGGGAALHWGGLLVSPPFLIQVKEGVWEPRREAAFGESEIPPVDAAWLAGAELLLAYYDFAGVADVLVEAPNLTVDAAESGSPSYYTVWRAPWF
jgi:hypothetical protein